MEPQVSKGTSGKVSPPFVIKDQYVAQRARGAYLATVYQPEAAFDLSSAAQHTEPSDEELKANSYFKTRHESMKLSRQHTSYDSPTLGQVSNLWQITRQ